MSKNKIQEEIEKAIRWLSSEHYFFKSLKEDLNELKIDLSSAKEKESVKEIKKALRDFKYIGKSERRFERYEQDIEKEAEILMESYKSSFSDNVEELKKVMDQIHVEAANLVRVASYFEGEIRKRLNFLLNEVRINHDFDDAKRKLRELESIVAKSDEWIKALDVSLADAKKVCEKELDDIMKKQQQLLAERPIIDNSPKLRMAEKIAWLKLEKSYYLPQSYRRKMTPEGTEYPVSSRKGDEDNYFIRFDSIYNIRKLILFGLKNSSALKTRGYAWRSLMEEMHRTENDLATATIRSTIRDTTRGIKSAKTFAYQTVGTEERFQPVLKDMIADGVLDQNMTIDEVKKIIDKYGIEELTYQERIIIRYLVLYNYLKDRGATGGYYDIAYEINGSSRSNVGILHEWSGEVVVTCDFEAINVLNIDSSFMNLTSKYDFKDSVEMILKIFAENPDKACPITDNKGIIWPAISDKDLHALIRKRELSRKK